MLEPSDLASVEDGEWIDIAPEGAVVTTRYELRLPGSSASLQQASDIEVVVTGTGDLIDPLGPPSGPRYLEPGDIARDLASTLQGASVSAVAVGNRVFFFDATSVSGAVPAITQDEAVYSITGPTAVGDVEAGEWIEVNFGDRVRRFEFSWGVDVPIMPGSIRVLYDPLDGNADFLDELKAAIDAETGSPDQAYIPPTGPRRLILSGVVHVQGGGVDPDMEIERGFVVNVPDLEPESDGEYVELYEKESESWIRFEIDMDDPERISPSAVRVNLFDPLSSVTSDADALENEIETRGFSTILFQDLSDPSLNRVYMFSGTDHTLLDVRVGDAGATHLAIEDPGTRNNAEYGVVEYHAGMTDEQIAERMADAMADQIADKGLYLRAASSGAEAGVLDPADAGDSFHTANDLSNFGYKSGAHSIIVSGAIDPQELLLEWPGAVDEPGHRDLTINYLVEDHYLTGGSSPDITDGITTKYYNFADIYGYDTASGEWLLNQITEAQKERTREVLALYSEYLGVSFVETASSGFLVATGDLKAVGQFSEPLGIVGVGGQGIRYDFGDMALMDEAEDWGSSEFGGAWFQTAMHEIGHVLGFGHTYDLVADAIMGRHGRLAVNEHERTDLPRCP